MSADRSPPELGSLKLRVGAQTTQGPAPTAQVPANIAPSLQALAAAIAQVGIAQQNNTGPIEFTKFISYEYDENFLTPSDGSSFTLAVDQLSPAERAAIVCGTRVEVSIDDKVQSISYITKVRTRSARSGGSIVTVECMDWLNRAVKGHVDPNTRFSPTMTFLQLVQAVLAPFGMDAVAEDNNANKSAMTGAKYGTTSKRKGSALKNKVAHQLKPYVNEGAFAFASRVCQRVGMWIWPSVDGHTCVVGKPDFDQEARYTLTHTLDSRANKVNNVQESDVEVSDEDQPNILFASGFGGGGEFAKSRLRAGIINPIVQPPANSLAAIAQVYPNVPFILAPIPAIASGLATFPILNPNAVPLFLYDPESHTQDELNTFLQRELSLLMRKSLVARYTFEGHKLGGQPVAVDTIVDINDDRSNLHIPMWILSRKFHKAGHEQGTKTTIECIRPGTLTF